MKQTVKHRTRAIVLMVIVALIATGGYFLWRQTPVQEVLLSRMDVTALSDRVATNPMDWRAQYWYGRRLAEAGELEQAEKALRVSLGNDPDFLPGYIELGKTLLAQNRVEEGFQLLRMASGRDPQNAEAHLALAVLYRTQGAYHRAESEAKEVLKREPENLTALYELAASQALMLQYANAEGTLRKALRKAPTDVRNLLGLSRVLLEQGKMEESEKLARQALAGEPQNLDCMVQLAKVLLRAGSTRSAEDEALKLLEQAKASDGERLDVAWLIGKTLISREEWAKAIPELLRVTLGSPDTTQAYFLLAKAFRQLGQVDKAVQAEARFKTLDAYDRAADALNEKIASSPDNAELRFKLGDLQASVGRKSLAIASYRAGLQRQPENQQARQKLTALQAEAVKK